MSGARKYHWLCFSCNQSGQIDNEGDGAARLLCKAALDHATRNPKCTAVQDAVCFPTVSGVFLQARAEIMPRKVANGC